MYDMSNASTINTRVQGVHNVMYTCIHVYTYTLVFDVYAKNFR